MAHHFQFRFATLKKLLERQQKVAEMQVFEIQKRIDQARSELADQEAKIHATINQWEHYLQTDPTIATNSRESLEKNELVKRDITQTIDEHLVAYKNAEQVLQDVMVGLKSIEEIEKQDFNAYEANARRKKKRELQEDLFRQWYRSSHSLNKQNA